jgi:hypothetical protein
MLILLRKFFLNHGYFLRHHIWLLNLNFSSTDLNVLLFRSLWIWNLVIIHIIVNCEIERLLFFKLRLHYASKIFGVHPFLSAAIHQRLILIPLNLLSILMCNFGKCLLLYNSWNITFLKFRIHNSLWWAGPTESKVLVHTGFVISRFLILWFLLADVTFLKLLLWFLFIVIIFVYW